MPWQRTKAYYCCDRFEAWTSMQTAKYHADLGTRAGLTLQHVLLDRPTRHGVTSYANYYAPLLAVGFYTSERMQVEQAC